ncbi:MAG: hypothetical protein ACI93L_002818 [Cyclobacteriaceae bacterium]
MLLTIAFHILFFIYSDNPVVAQVESSITGVYQGRTLFLQNPYDQDTQSYCVENIFVNERPVNFNPRQSAIKIDFKGVDIYSPVYLRFIHKDKCAPLVINPDAIAYHNSFGFQKIDLMDTLLSWESQGEKETSYYIVEKIEMGLWTEQDTIDAKGVFGGAEYEYRPILSHGPNKFRIKYIFPSGEYLNSRDIDMHFYPDEVTFRPTATDSKLFLSRGAEYKIYDGGGKLVMTGRGVEIDVTSLPSGEYVVYFDEEYPGVFRKK